MSNGLHAAEKRQIERLLRRWRADRLADRMLVVEAFLTSEEHFTDEEWREVLTQRGVALEPGFVTETLDMLTQFGLATRQEFDGTRPRYEHRHLGEHHDHLICTRCRSIEEFHHPQLEALQHQIVVDHGFHHLRHKLQIYGLCRDCLADRKPALPLTLASPGERVRVERVNGGTDVSGHLAGMGITVGKELEVISSGKGPAVVAVQGSRMALGHGVAEKIHVSLLRQRPSVSMAETSEER